MASNDKGLEEIPEGMLAFFLFLRFFVLRFDFFFLPS